MRPNSAHLQRQVAFSGTDGDGADIKVWVPKTPTPRRSVFSEARHAVCRVIGRMKSKPARLVDKLAHLDKSNDLLRKDIVELREQLHISKPNDRLDHPEQGASEFYYLRSKRADLVNAHKKLDARKFVLGEVVTAEAQLTRVIAALNDTNHDGIAFEANAFFQQLEDLDAHRRGEEPQHTTAALFGARMHLRLKKMSVVQGAALQRSAVNFLNKKDPPSDAEKAVVQSILLGLLARPLPSKSKTDKATLQKLDSSRLAAIELSAAAVLDELKSLGLNLQPKDEVPGTGLELRALKRLLKDVKNVQKPLQKKKAIAPTTGPQPGAPTASKAPTKPVHKATQPPVATQPMARPGKATTDPAQRAFQSTLLEAMKFMWNEDGSEDGFAEVLDTTAAGLFVKAMVQLRAAGLSDVEQRQWIRDALGSVDGALLSHLCERMNKGFQDRLLDEIDNSHFDHQQDLKNLASLWRDEVTATTGPSA